MTDPLTHAVFAGRLDEVFRIHTAPDATVEARLVEVAERAHPAHPGRTPFTLLFRGPMDPMLPQRTYGVEHAELGVLEIFLVPVGPDGVGMRYEAVFS